MSEMGGRTDLQEKGERVEKNMEKKNECSFDLECFRTDDSHTV